MTDDGGRIAESTVQVTFTHPATLPIFIPIGKLTMPTRTLSFWGGESCQFRLSLIGGLRLCRWQFFFPLREATDFFPIRSFFVLQTHIDRAGHCLPRKSGKFCTLFYTVTEEASKLTVMPTGGDHADLPSRFHRGIRARPYAQELLRLDALRARL